MEGWPKRASLGFLSACPYSGGETVRMIPVLLGDWIAFDAQPYSFNYYIDPREATPGMEQCIVAALRAGRAVVLRAQIAYRERTSHLGVLVLRRNSICQ